MKKLLSASIFAVVLFLFTFLCGTAAAQDTLPEKYRVDIAIRYIVEDHLTRTVTISVHRKEGSKSIPVKWAIVNLYLNDITKLGMLGNITTDQNGEGVIPLDVKFKYLTDSLKIVNYNFIASLQNNPEIESVSASLNVREANLRLHLYEENSLRKIKAVLMAVDSTGMMHPVSGSRIIFAVKRDSAIVPLTPEPVLTNLKGEAILDLRDDIESDSANVITLVAQTHEQDEFGVLISKKTISWGVPQGSPGNRTNYIIFIVLAVVAAVIFYVIRFKGKDM